MSLESLTATVGRELNPIDFAEGLYQGTIGQPLKALKQLTGAKIEETDHSDDTLALKAGNLAGTAIDFAILSRLSKGLLNPRLGKAAETVVGSSVKMGVTGAVYGGLLTPSRDDRSLLEGRLENGFVYASSLSVMGASSKLLERNAFLAQDTFVSKGLKNAIAGGLSGVPAAYGSVAFNEHRVADASEVTAYVAQNAAFGAAFGVADHAIGQVAKSPEFQEKYYSTKWSAERKLADARRNTYITLDKIGMRHPLQMVGDLILGGGETAVADSAPRPQLTADNNPINAFERAVPQFISAMEANESNFGKIGKDGYELHKQREAIHAQFANSLLEIWHGTPETPGLKNHSDIELATPSTPAERVAQIREALTSSTRARVLSRESPFDDAMHKLIPNLDDLNGDYSSMLQGLGGGRERFYNYSEDDLFKRMNMPRLHSYVDHEMNTPVEWSPIEPSDVGPRYFHGTMSRALPSLFTERTLFSARELRGRGIEQVTGESANEDLGRRNVSITRDFNEAWAYHRTSPAFLSDYPVVLGISGAAASHAWTAGGIEPGEILVDKLSIGNSLSTRLGLKRPEITHIFIPDSEVPSVINQLQARRISGVQVVGLSDLTTPQWQPEPTIEELRERYGAN